MKLPRDRSARGGRALVRWSDAAPSRAPADIRPDCWQDSGVSAVPRAQLRPWAAADPSPSNRIDDELPQTAAERSGQRQRLPVEIVELTQQLLAADISTYPHQQCRIA